MPLVEANNIKIYYETKGSGTPITLINGWGGNLNSWSNKMIDLLSEKHQGWHHFVGNPVLQPEELYEMWMGGGNLYAPAILKRDDGFWMWYGAQNPRATIRSPWHSPKTE